MGREQAKKGAGGLGDDTYWTVTDADQFEFALYVDGEARARAFQLHNTALIDQGRQLPQLHVTLRLSEVVFDAVEAHLGIDKPVSFKPEGAASPDYRAVAARSAATFREAYSGAKETRYYLYQARKQLKGDGEVGEQSPDAEKALVQIGRALEHLETEDRPTPVAQAHIRSAYRIFRRAEVISLREMQAMDYCQKAVISMFPEKSEAHKDPIARAIAKVKAKEEQRDDRTKQDKGRGLGD